ncbi:MAG: hypothetical protein E6I28_02040 [Chloroflexi bacterium]|nr:MAG: hypothetical protein E6I28_02040 [Chloroflexota bacterium]
MRGVLQGWLLLVLSITLGACAAPAATIPSGGPAIQVLGTENFYADLLAQIGGERVTASSILNDPSADPHEYEASPAAAKLVADSKLVIVNGIGYDDFMDKLLGAATRPDRVVINVQDISDKVGALKTKYAGSPVAFTENVAGYLTDAIGLKVLTPPAFMEAIESGTDPAPADVAAERDLITGRKVKVLLYNSQVTSPLTQQIHDLADRSGVPIVGVAETIPPAFKTFQEWQLAQLTELEKALAR